MNQNEKKLKPWLNDIAVLSIFFARPAIFAKSFERIREARPRVLLLWQDGPREGKPDDIAKIEACRQIAANIDWECEVHTNYHDKNMGCDPSTHFSHKWAFSIVDKCIILEDDVIPSLSFFPFCKVLLDKYEYDERVDRICGLNMLGEYNCDGDYCFAKYGCSIGWATWKRVADKWETDYSFLDNMYAKRMLEIINQQDGGKSIIQRAEKEREEGIPYWEMVTGVESILNSGLIIYPSKNLIENIGVGEDSTHTPSDMNQISPTAQLLYKIKANEYSFPLNHPKYIFADPIFLKEWKVIMTPSSKERIKYLLSRLTINIVKKLNLKFLK